MPQEAGSRPINLKDKSGCQPLFRFHVCTLDLTPPPYCQEPSLPSPLPPSPPPRRVANTVAAVTAAAAAAAAALALGYAAIAAFEAELPAPPSRSARPPCTRPLAPGDAAFGLCHAPLACVGSVVVPLLACKQRRSPLRRPARCPSFGAGGVGARGGGGWRRRVTWEARAGSRLPDRPVARTVRRASRGAGLARRGNCAQGGGRVGGGTDELQCGAAGAVRCGRGGARARSGWVWFHRWRGAAGRRLS